MTDHSQRPVHLKNGDCMLNICMICAGNICRSPMAEAILRNECQKRGFAWTVSSAGTGSWHQGKNADSRTREVLKAHDIDLVGHQAKQFHRSYFDKFDVILAMDRQNLRDISKLAATSAQRAKLGLYLEFGTVNCNGSLEVADPYWGTLTNFEDTYRVLNNHLDKLVEGLLKLCPNA